MNNQKQYTFFTKQGNLVDIIAHSPNEAYSRIDKLGIKGARLQGISTPPMHEKLAQKESYQYAWEQKPDARPGKWVGGTRIESPIRHGKQLSYKPLNK